ncbi:MAG: hypothetical protein JW763_01305 [candidate division Zixibacteria bacterium]|nr:hypothetical protein [candidate division Zixibacteria bacterium]
MMKLQSLDQHIKRLAKLDGTKVPIISCYLDLGSEGADWQTTLMQREKEILSSPWPTATKSGIVSAFNSIKRWLNSELEPSSRGSAIFARAREGDVFIPMQFGVPLPSDIAIDSVPHLYQLVRVKDSLHEYIVLYSDSKSARIYEVNLGKISEHMIINRPDLRPRIGREWTKLHYSRQRRERGRQFLKQKIDILNSLISERPDCDLILAGDSTYLTRLTRELPRKVADRLVDAVAISKPHSTERILQETLAAYVKAEEEESLDTVDRLFLTHQRGDLATIGVPESLQAVFHGQADILVLCHTSDLGKAHSCSKCGWIAYGEQNPEVCANCGNTSLIKRDVRQELTRMARSTQCEIETVASSERLAQVGGAGCLLRFRHETLGHDNYQLKKGNQYVQ